MRRLSNFWPLSLTGNPFNFEVALNLLASSQNCLHDGFFSWPYVLFQTFLNLFVPNIAYCWIKSELECLLRSDLFSRIRASGFMDFCRTEKTTAFESFSQRRWVGVIFSGSGFDAALKDYSSASQHWFESRPNCLFRNGAVGGSSSMPVIESIWYRLLAWAHWTKWWQSLYRVALISSRENNWLACAE